MSSKSFMLNIAVEQAANKTQISETRRSERFLIDATQLRMGAVTVQQGHMGFSGWAPRGGGVDRSGV